MLLGRESILSASDLATEDVDVPEWGGTVRVRVMEGTERDRWEVIHVKDPTNELRARVVAATVCDEAGKPIFSAADIAALGRKNANALDRVFKVATRLNRMSKADVDAAEKNSDSSLSEGSASASLGSGDAASGSSSPDSTPPS